MHSCSVYIRTSHDVQKLTAQQQLLLSHFSSMEDIRKYFSSSKRTASESTAEKDVSIEEDTSASAEFSHTDMVCEPPWKKVSSENHAAYKAKLSYKKKWEEKYPWVSCVSPADGMFCSICQKWGKPPAKSRGGWTTRGITDWNHASELLKQHADSLWHGDAAATAAMAQQVERSGQSVLELHCSSAAREAAERIQRNRSIITKLLRAVYFLVKHRIPHTPFINLCFSS